MQIIKMTLSLKERERRKKEQLERVAKKTQKTDPADWQFDPFVGFGQYKDRGIRLSELPLDYLEFLTEPLDTGEDFNHGGVNWAIAAKAEIQRRKRGDPIPDKVPLEVFEDDEKPLKGSHPRLKTEVAFLSMGAIDDVANLLLKDFITREDKEQGFVAWTTRYVQEAARYGVISAIDVVNPAVEIVSIAYRKHVLKVRVASNRLTLEKVYLESLSGWRS